MLQGGGDAEASRPWWPTRITGPVVAAALTIAAVLAVAGIAAQTAGFSGASFGDRVAVGAVYSISAMGLVLAATVALRWSEAASDELTSRPRWRTWAYDAMGVIAVGSAGASGWAMVDAFIRGSAGGDEPHLEIQRFALAAAALAPALLAVAAIVVIVWARRRNQPGDAGETADGIARDGFAKGLLGPTIGCLLAAGIVSVAIAVDTAFTLGSASVGDRLAAVSVSASHVTTAFFAFAVVVLVAIGRRRRARDGAADPVVMSAGCIGLFVAVAAAYAVWKVVTASSSHSANGPVTFYTLSWWMRIAEIATALAAGTIAVVAASAARRLTREPDHGGDELTGEAAPWAPREPARDPGPIVAIRPTGARLVAVLLALSAVAYAAFTVLSIVGGYEIAVNDLIAELSSYVSTVAGLAVAAALVMAASRLNVTGRDALNDAVDAIVAIIAVAVVAISGYSICFILFGHHTGRLSVFAHVSIAQRLDRVGTSIAAALIGAAALHLIARGRNTAPDEEAA